MALSKHDQVLMPSYTRFEGRKPPVCIACDRPLGNKRRMRELPKSSQDNLMKNGKKPLSPREKIREAEVASGPNSNAATFPSVAGGKVERKPEGGGSSSKLLPINSAPALPSRNGANFVMRGGFRMSKKTNSPTMTQSFNAMPMMIDESSPMHHEMSRTQEISKSANNASPSVSKDDPRPKTAQPRIKY